MPIYYPATPQINERAPSERPSPAEATARQGVAVTTDLARPQPGGGIDTSIPYRQAPPLETLIGRRSFLIDVIGKDNRYELT